MLNILKPEQFIGERVQERQREAEKHYLLARLYSSHPSLVQHLLVGLGTFFVIFGTRMVRLAQRDWHTA